MSNKNSIPETSVNLLQTCQFSACRLVGLLVGLSTAILVLIADQLTKWAVLNLSDSPLYPVTSFFNIILVWNRGISFGLLSSHNPFGKWILCGLSLAFAIILLVWIGKALTKLSALAFGLILGGAVGNLVDRVRFGAVADFVDFHVYGYHWYTFNIADCAIVAGVGLIILEQGKEYGKANMIANRQKKRH
jgi:signal peptidase II